MERGLKKSSTTPASVTPEKLKFEQMGQMQTSYLFNWPKCLTVLSWTYLIS
jgi:hypothetical protein